MASRPSAPGSCRGGALACAGNPALGAWDGRVAFLTVFFDPPVNSQTALQQIDGIFPTDAQHSDIVTGHNSSASPNQTGTCGNAVYTSAALGAAVRTVSPTWTGNANKATLTLYSGGNADGSDSVFDNDAVHQVSIGLHDSGPDPPAAEQPRAFRSGSCVAAAIEAAQTSKQQQTPRRRTPKTFALPARIPEGVVQAGYLAALESLYLFQRR